MRFDKLRGDPLRVPSKSRGSVCAVAGCGLTARLERRTGPAPFVAYCSRHARDEAAGVPLALELAEPRRP